MRNLECLPALPGCLLPWYENNRRDLPWRADRNPYHIWISEIMLQQTRVEAVKKYYLRFITELPTVAQLARCEDERLQKLWEGLGYYTRVRNLKRAAQCIEEKFNGEFPRAYSDIRSLPGIGDYTAGAICSIAFDEPTPAVDGNVLRVLSRFLDDHRIIDSGKIKKEYARYLTQIYPSQAGKFTQALMELGATLCEPGGKPDCRSCPCAELCAGFRAGTAGGLPVRQPKKERKREKLTVFILSCEGAYALEKRTQNGVLAGLWQIPNCCGALDAAQALQTVQNMGLQPVQLLRQVQRGHVFTHITWEMTGFYLEVKQTDSRFTWRTLREIQNSIALPTAFRQFLDDFVAADS